MKKCVNALKSQCNRNSSFARHHPVEFFRPRIIRRFWSRLSDELCTKSGRIRVHKSIAYSQQKSDLHPDRDFHSLDGVQQKQLEVFIKVIKLDGILEFAIGQKCVSSLVGHDFTKRVPISTQAVISIATQAFDGSCIICHFKAAIFKDFKRTSS